MSIRVLWWAMGTHRVRSCTCRCVLMALADATPDDHGLHAFPSARSIAERMDLSLRTVQRELAWMESAGIIRRGDQSYVSRYPAQTRPIVWDLDVDGPEPGPDAVGAGARAMPAATKPQKTAMAKGKGTSQKTDTTNCRSTDSAATGCRSSYDTDVAQYELNNSLNSPHNPPKGGLPPVEGNHDGKNRAGGSRDGDGRGEASTTSPVADSLCLLDAFDDGLRPDPSGEFVPEEPSGGIGAPGSDGAAEPIAAPAAAHAPAAAGGTSYAVAGVPAGATDSAPGERVLRASRRLVAEHHRLIGERGLEPRTWPRREVGNASWLISTLTEAGRDPDQAVDDILSAVVWALSHDFHRARVLTLRSLASDWAALRQDIASPRSRQGQGTTRFGRISPGVTRESAPGVSPAVAASYAPHRQLTRAYSEGHAVYWGEQWLEPSNLGKLYQHCYDEVDPGECPVCASDAHNRDHHGDMARLRDARKEGTA